MFKAKWSRGAIPEQILFCDNLEILYTLVEAGLAFAIISAPCSALFSPIFGTFLCQRSLPSPLVLSTCRENSPPRASRFLTLLEENLQTDPHAL